MEYMLEVADQPTAAGHGDRVFASGKITRAVTPFYNLAAVSLVVPPGGYVTLKEGIGELLL